MVCMTNKREMPTNAKKKIAIKYHYRPFISMWTETEKGQNTPLLYHLTPPWDPPPLCTKSSAVRLDSLPLFAPIGG